MNKLKSIASNIHKHISIKGLLITCLVLTFMVGFVRPVVLNTLYPDTVSTAAAKKKLPIYCVDTGGDKKISISFDAAWGCEDTDTLLDILERNDVKATFFLCGYWVDKYPEEVKKIHSKGHDIGNHSSTHPHSSQLSLEGNKKELMDAHEKVKTLLGIDMNLYRPPFGEYNDTVLDAAKECGYYTIQWDIDTLETKIEVIKPTKILVNYFYFY